MLSVCILDAEKLSVDTMFTLGCKRDGSQGVLNRVTQASKYHSFRRHISGHVGDPDTRFIGNLSVLPSASGYDDNC